MKGNEMDEIVEFLCQTLAELLKIPRESVGADSDLLIDLSVDSLDTVELLMIVEDKYGYYVPDSQLIQMRTVDDLAKNIWNKIHEEKT